MTAGIAGVTLAKQVDEDCPWLAPVYEVYLNGTLIGEVTQAKEMTYYPWRGLSVIQKERGGRMRAIKFDAETRKKAIANLVSTYVMRAKEDG